MLLVLTASSPGFESCEACARIYAFIEEKEDMIFKRGLSVLILLKLVKGRLKKY